MSWHSYIVMGLASLLSGPAQAGPWAHELGEGYAKVGWGYFDGRAAFDTSTGLQANAVEAYGEVGLGHDVEVDASARYVDHRTELGQSSGLQDLEALVEWVPNPGPTTVALTAGLRVSPYRRGLTPELGPGGTDVLFGLGWGRSLGAGWAIIEAQLRHRVAQPSSAVRLRTELGVQGSSPVGGALTLDLQPSFGRTSQLSVGGPAPIPRLLSVGAKAFVVAPGDAVRPGLAVDAAWLPPVINDGPGLRLGAGVTVAW